MLINNHISQKLKLIGKGELIWVAWIQKNCQTIRVQHISGTDANVSDTHPANEKYFHFLLSIFFFYHWYGPDMVVTWLGTSQTREGKKNK